MLTQVLIRLSIIYSLVYYSLVYGVLPAISMILPITGLSEDFHAKDSKPSSDPPCVIEKLCSLHDGLVLEAKGIKEHFWKPYIRKLYEKKVCK